MGTIYRLEIFEGNSVTRIVINRCFGGFGLSDSAMMEIADRKGWTLVQKGRSNYFKSPEDEIADSDIPRDDPDLVATVETLGEPSWGPYAELQIVEIPDDVEWTIEEYDGREWIAERHRVWP